jgi:hypothetical protein
MNKVNGSSLDVERLFYANDNVILWNNTSNLINVVDLSSETEPLRILTSDNIGNIDLITIIDQFEYTYDCNVHLVEYSDKVFVDKLRMKLLAGDSDFDIYLVNDPTRDNLLDSILKYNLYEPLDDYTEIVKNFSYMYQGIRPMMSCQDKLFGVPYELSIFSSMDIQCDFQQYGYTNPDMHWTIKDVWNLCEEVLNSRETNISVFSDPYGMLSFIEIFVQDSINQNNLSRNNLSELLTNVKKYYDAGVLFDPAGSKKHLLQYSTNYFGQFIAHSPIPAYSIYGTVMEPANNEIIYHELLGCAMMNHRSNNKEMAAGFLEVMTDDKNIYNTKTYKTLLGSDLSKYNIYDEWSVTELSYLSDLPEIFKKSGIFTYDVSSLFDFLIENVMFQFYDGTITVKEAADMIYDRVNYTYFE